MYGETVFAGLWYKGVPLYLDGTTLRCSPRKVFVPADNTFPTLVPAQRNAASDVLVDAALPSGFPNRAVDGLNLCPALIGGDIRQIRCSKQSGGSRHARASGG